MNKTKEQVAGKLFRIAMDKLMSMKRLKSVKAFPVCSLGDEGCMKISPWRSVYPRLTPTPTATPVVCNLFTMVNSDVDKTAVKCQCGEFTHYVQIFKTLSRTTCINYCLFEKHYLACLLYTSPSPRDQRGSRMPSSA